MDPYPEIARLERAWDQIGQAVQEFLDETGLVLAEENEYGELYAPSESLEQSLAGVFGVDLKEVERERREMLRRLSEVATQKGEADE